MSAKLRNSRRPETSTQIFKIKQQRGHSSTKLGTFPANGEDIQLVGDISTALAVGVSPLNYL